MKLLITGAAGFIGSNLVEKALESGHQVIGIDNLDPYYSANLKTYNLKRVEHTNFTFHRMDINSPTLASFIASIHPDVIIHLAAKAGVRNSIEHPQDYVHANIDGTVNILEAARRVGIQRLLLASSSSVYGTNTTVPFSESDVVESQISPYASTKRAVEVLSKTYAHSYGLHIQCFRFFTVYGPSGRPDMAPYLFTHAIDQGNPIKVYGSTNTERDYTYVGDICDGLLAALDRDDTFEIYNLGNNTPVTLASFIHEIETHLGKKAKIILAPKQPGDVERTWANIDKAQKNLGYHPKTSLHDGLGHFISWYKQHSSLY